MTTFQSAQITAAADSFVRIGMWSYGDGSAGFTIGGLNATQLLLQHSTSAFNVSTPHTAVWSYTVAVFRVIAANPNIYILADTGAAGLRYIDDIEVDILDDVSLTVTPASAANSVESGGIRIDGYDNAPVNPIPVVLGATSGRVVFGCYSRHGSNNQVFGQSGNIETYGLLYNNANNYIEFYVDNDSANIYFEITVGGVLTQDNAVARAGLFGIDTLFIAEFEYSATQCILRIDGVDIVTLVPGAGIDFGANIPDQFWAGSNTTGIQQADSVFVAPS